MKLESNVIKVTYNEYIICNGKTHLIKSNLLKKTKIDFKNIISKTNFIKIKKIKIFIKALS